MFFQPLIGAALALAATANPIIKEQQPVLSDGLEEQQVDLIKELEKAHIIPTILDPFVPLLTLNATWKKATADLGNTIKPKKAKKEPVVHFLDTVPFSSFSMANNDHTNLLNSGIQLTIALTDPDAPSRNNPKWSQICHWIATDVHLTPSSGSDNNNDFHIIGGGQKHQTLTEIMPYKPPGPPPKTGKHRYVFVALAPRNGTTERLHLSTPGDRQRWGFEGERAGLREWAGKNGLGVVGANFVYAQHKKQ
ncbi:hypothetical protein MBLNU13_g00237t1 [Cladosporium sp. NU13]